MDFEALRAELFSVRKLTLSGGLGQVEGVGNFFGPPPPSFAPV